jgi:DNA repair protein RecN (Recombination protein N)
MLESLRIRNFAIIDEVEVELDNGMTVLTGETGAGKSILVDALGLVLGERGSATLVRQGAERAELSAEFATRALPAVCDWLAEQELDMDGECVVRRVIGADGRSRAFINGNPVPLQSLKALGEKLVDIHGQHFHQSLAKRRIQRQLLDFYGGLDSQLQQVRDAFTAWRTLANKLEALENANADRAARLDLLQYQVRELEALDLAGDEIDELEAERQKLANAGNIVDGVSVALRAIFDEDEGNAQSLIAEAGSRLERLVDMDKALEAPLALLTEAGIQVTEAADALRHYADSLDMDPARRDWVEERLNAIHNVARKHRVDPGELVALHTGLAEELDDLLHAEERGAELSRKTSSALETYRAAAAKLSAARQKTSRAFAGAVTAAMAGLGMPGGIFEVAIDSDAAREPRADGIDTLEFLITANPGQPPQPLARIASGGELSRMSLAIQVIASGGSDIPVMVFDEVDSGVGGGVAEMVGRRLSELGGDRQVLCVTHLPQVASQADHHLRINKISDKKSTRISVSTLNHHERVEELSRMLGGVKITQRTREHAEEMLEAARKSAGSDKASA